MKRIFAHILLLVIACSDSRRPTSNEVIVDAHVNYFIPHEDARRNMLFDDAPEYDTVASSLVVNHDTLRNIQFTRSELRGDTFTIVIHQTDPAYHHAYVITVVGNTYNITYNFLTSGEQRPRSIVPTEMKLVLNTLEFKSGTVVRGHTEFKGMCTGDCWEPRIEVEGNFKVAVP